MNLSLPSSDVLGATTSTVLARLAAVSEGLTGRRIAALAQLAPTSVNRALVDLEHIGLVNSTPAGNAKIYRLNREHILWGPLEQLLATPDRLVELGSEIARTAVGEAASVLIYGSTARGEADRDSDIDVLVIWERATTPDERETALAALDTGLYRLAGNRVAILDLTASELARLTAAGDPLADSWRREARSLWGRTFASLAVA